jgi:hypothetical protein
MPIICQVCGRSDDKVRNVNHSECWPGYDSVCTRCCKSCLFCLSCQIAIGDMKHGYIQVSG